MATIPPSTPYAVVPAVDDNDWKDTVSTEREGVHPPQPPRHRPPSTPSSPKDDNDRQGCRIADRHALTIGARRRRSIRLNPFLRVHPDHSTSRGRPYDTATIPPSTPRHRLPLMPSSPIDDNYLEKAALSTGQPPQHRPQPPTPSSPRWTTIEKTALSTGRDDVHPTVHASTPTATYVVAPGPRIAHLHDNLPTPIPSYRSPPYTHNKQATIDRSHPNSTPCEIA